jgi:hypothetical protein
MERQADVTNGRAGLALTFAGLSLSRASVVNRAAGVIVPWSRRRRTAP